MIGSARERRLGLSLAALALAAACAAPARFDLMRGVCVAHIHRRGQGYGSDASRATLERLRGLGVNWISLTPFGYQRSVGSPPVIFRGDRSLRDSGIVQEVIAARALGIRTLIKPHLWGGDFYEGRWTGEIEMGSDADWDEWFRTYEEFILHYARLAQRAEAAAFSIGCELGAATRAKPDRWRALIARVRSVYRGRLTYAANWHEEYERVPFWDALDWIGVNAYFPLSTARTPRAAEIERAWAPIARRMESLSRRAGRPIVLTEIGYRSVDHSAAEPHGWPEFDEDPKPNDAAQSACYEGTLRALWGKRWLRGIYWWKYYTTPEGEGPEAADFSPRGKPAEQALATYYRAPDPREEAPREAPLDKPGDRADDPGP
jgi:hypothetical protein